MQPAEVKNIDCDLNFLHGDRVCYLLLLGQVIARHQFNLHQNNEEANDR